LANTLDLHVFPIHLVTGQELDQCQVRKDVRGVERSGGVVKVVIAGVGAVVVVVVSIVVKGGIGVENVVVVVVVVDVRSGISVNVVVEWGRRAGGVGDKRLEVASVR
jgi:hypothetical protein